MKIEAPDSSVLCFKYFGKTIVLNILKTSTYIFETHEQAFLFFSFKANPSELYFEHHPPTIYFPFVQFALNQTIYSKTIAHYISHETSNPPTEFYNPKEPTFVAK